MAIKTVHAKKSNHVVQEIDERKKEIIYYLLPDTSQRKHFKQIKISGFVKLPPGFWSEGYGLTRLGGYILRALAAELGEVFDLSFTKDGRSIIRRSSRPSVVFNYGDYSAVLDELKAIRSAKNKESTEVTLSFLNQWFPKVFKDKKKIKKEFSYEEDKLSKILNSDPNLVSKLSKNDITKILEIYPLIVSVYSGSGRSEEKLKNVVSSKAAADKVVLKKLIAEFEKRLNKKTQSESEWQRFLQEHILLFNTAYVAALGKASVSLQGKYPDFMMIDVFNYVDIFEIKRPNTSLLLHDSSRNNFYWDSELSKAISQVENYISYLMQNGPAFEKDARTLKGLSLSVVKPRGVIIAGTRAELDSTKKKDDFRLLRSSLKNIDIVLFDDFLDRLKNLEKRIGK